MVWVVLELRKNLSFTQTRNIIHWHSKKIFQSFPEYGEYKIRAVPPKHPPPVAVKGPFTPGDSRGLTFQTENAEDAEKFVAHMMRSGFFTNSWIENDTTAV